MRWLLLLLACSAVAQTFTPESYGAKRDGRTNDLAAFQAATDAADAAGGGTIVLSNGKYNLGGTWKIGSANFQHFISIVGQNQATTILLSGVTGNTPAIYLNQEKRFTLRDFSVQQASPRNGYGIVMGGDAVSGGTETTEGVVENVAVSGFNRGIDTAAGNGVASEITFINVHLDHCATGFYTGYGNALAFTFIQPVFQYDAIGADVEFGGIHALGGSGSHNGTDFRIAGNDATNIVGYRSEAATLPFDLRGIGKINLDGIKVTGLATPNAQTAVHIADASVSITNSKIGGQISVQAPSPAQNASFTLRNNLIIDPQNTWTATTSPVNMGPGFRIDPSAGTGTLTWASENNQIGNNNTDTNIGHWPSGYGIMTTDSSGRLIAPAKTAF